MDMMKFGNWLDLPQVKTCEQALSQVYKSDEITDENVFA